MTVRDDELTMKARYACRRSTLGMLGAVAPGSLTGGQIQMRIWSRWRFALGMVLVELVAAGDVLAEQSHTGYRYRLNLRPHGERWCHRCRVRPPTDGDRYCGDCRHVLAWSPAAGRATALPPIRQHTQPREASR